MLIEIIPAFIILFGLLALNVPIYIALLSSGLYMQFFINGMPLAGAVTAMFETVTKSSLLAIPFFILAGSFMAGGSLGKRLIDLCSALLRSVRGGMAIACLIANALFGAISGSPPAATATFSKILYRPLEDQYGEKNALGIIVGAAGLSSIIPPSVAMIIYGVVAEVSIAKLFIAGVLPGILLVTIIGVYIVAKYKNKEQVAAATWKEKGDAFVKSLPVLLLPVLILGGIYGGVFTPTEAGALSAVYAAAVSVFVLKDIDLKGFFRVLKGGTVTSVQVFVLVACSGVFAQALTVTQAPAMIVEMFGTISVVGFLLILNVILMIFGCFFDGSSAILILVPLVMPTALSLGIDPIHLGMVFTINLAIGMFTPPFGLNLFVAQGTLNKELITISKAAMPYIILYIIGVLLITFIPEISTLLPNMYM